MARWAIVIALVVSLGICGFFELRARLRLDATEQQIAARQADLEKIRDIDRQVQAYQKKKAELQRRLDLLQQVYAAAQRGAR